MKYFRHGVFDTRSHSNNITNDGAEMKLLTNFLYDEGGQGITEYGAILAFVAILIVVVANFVSGTLRSALANAFSLVGSALNSLNGQVS